MLLDTARSNISDWTCSEQEIKPDGMGRTRLTYPTLPIPRDFSLHSSILPTHHWARLMLKALRKCLQSTTLAPRTSGELLDRATLTFHHFYTAEAWQA